MVGSVASSTVNNIGSVTAIPTALPVLNETSIGWIGKKFLPLAITSTDVIVPAAKIYLKALEWSGGQKIYVPKFGLSDGMIKYIYKKLKKKSYPWIDSFFPNFLIKLASKKSSCSHFSLTSSKFSPYFLANFRNIV